MRDLLHSLWQEPRPPHPPPRVWWDWVLVGAFGSIALLEGVLRPELPWRTVSVIITIGLASTLLWRRTRPLLMVAITFGTFGLAPLLVGAELEMQTMVYVLILPYSLFRWGSGREAVLGVTIVLGKLGFSVGLGYVSLTDGAWGLVILSAVFALGAAVRYRARARARDLERVKLLEREQLARDLHDTVGHHVSAMAIRAQAGLATLASGPGAAEDALRVIEAEASRALTEMRTMVRALRRDEPAELAPSPSVRDLEQLAGESRAGPAVHVEIVGDLNDLPPPVAATIYRLAQESITNARRHARRATRIEVRVVADDASVRLQVSDDGDPLARSTASSGYGLIGMGERTDLLGGTFQAGPSSDRGWAVTAVLPRTGSPA